ncbi:MAG: Crp/Fnr family transcriptional regulator [Flavobacteriaceae bacterium]|nr:Crp/Fnr family transcriptional regulator [Flavobacteriaceae bacterium]
MKEIWYLECVNLFKIICPHQYKDYKKWHTLSYYKKKEYVYFDADASTTVYLINSGKIKLGYYTAEGKEIVKSILGKGEVFGEKAFLGEEKRNEFALSIDNKTVICPISVDTLQNMMKNNTSFTLSFYKLISYRIKKLERRLEILLFKDVRKRTIEFIEELKDEFGQLLLNGKILIKHPYSQKEIATLIGASRPSLNIVLNNLKDEDYLSFNGKEIILNKNAKVLDS